MTVLKKYMVKMIKENIYKTIKFIYHFRLQDTREDKVK